MREHNALRSYPKGGPRIAVERTFEGRIHAALKDEEFYEGDRKHGMGGYAYDGRWRAVARDLCADYAPRTVLQLGADKGYLVTALRQASDVEAFGTEISQYAIDKAVVPLVHAPYTALPFGDKAFDLAIAIGPVYTLSLRDAMSCLREIERVAKSAFITLASYDTAEELELMRLWSIGGNLILPKEHWLKLLNYCGYTGDYWFVTAKTLDLKWGNLSGRAL